MSQQHPLIVFLLLIVMGACLALLAVFFALRLVSGLPAGPAPRLPGPDTAGTQPGEPRPAGGWPLGPRLPAFPARPRPARVAGLRAREKFPWKVLPKIKLPGCSPGGRPGRAPAPAPRTRWPSPPRRPPGAAARSICPGSAQRAASRGPCTARSGRFSLDGSATLRSCLRKVVNGEGNGKKKKKKKGYYYTPSPCSPCVFLAIDRRRWGVDLL